jgi:hypothetical protein
VAQAGGAAVLTTDYRRARARVEGGGGVLALLIGAIDRETQFSVGRDADKLIQQLRCEVAALKQRLDVARTVQEVRR